MKAIITQLRQILQLLRPSSKTEWRVLIALLVYFSAISIPFCLTVQPELLGMLGYDTAGHLTVPDMKIDAANMFCWNLRHPLFRLLYLPVILINECLLLVGIDLTWPLFLCSSVILMSLSGLFIYKTLRALSVSTTCSILLLALFCSFAHTIMLSIQVDSFIMSLFFGSIMVLLFVTGKHNTLSDNLLFLGITGTTSTNCFKVAFYHLVEERSLRKAFIRFIQSIGIFCVLFALTFPNLVTRLIERPRGFLYAVMGDSFSFQGSDTSRWQLFIDNFLSDPILFHHTTGIIYSHDTIHLPSYPSVWFYVPIAVIFLLVLTSVIVNWRKPVIHLFCCCFVFDLFMHFGIGYGMEEGQLFCGHWLFFIPVVAGLTTNLNNSLGKTIQALVLMLTFFLLATNLYHLCQSFYSFTA